MKRVIRRLVILLALPGLLVLTSCTGYNDGSVSMYGSVSYGVYGGYGYPGYGYGGYPYRPGVPVYPNRPISPDRPDRPERPVKPNRPSTQPVNRSSGSMGRPSRMSGGGGRRR